MKKFVCSICGYVYEGESLPADFVCPICKAPASKFNEMGGDMNWAAEHVVGIASDVPEEIKAGLRENFNGECSEVGIYLAMSRVAFREARPNSRRKPRNSASMPSTTLSTRWLATKPATAKRSRASLRDISAKAKSDFKKRLHRHLPMQSFLWR